jgi:O-succinylbenzoic acid--CoA ligase
MLVRSDHLEELVARARSGYRMLRRKTVVLTPRSDPAGCACLLALLSLDCRVILVPGSNPSLAGELRQQYRHHPGLEAASLEWLQASPIDRSWQSDREPRGSVVLCSSGTTGPPKRVLLSAEALWTSAKVLTADWSSHTVQALQLPLWHVAGLSCLIRAWVKARPMLFASPTELPLCDGGQATHVSVVPAQLNRWLAQHSEKQLRRLSSGLAEMLVGGGPCPEALWQTALAAGFPIRLSFAMSEASSTIALSPVGSPSSPFEPLEHWQCREHEGRLMIRGPSLASGYLREDQLTPLADAEGWWLTSDLVDWEGTGFRWGARVDRLIISGGEKISPERLEVWIQTHAGQKAWVQGVPDTVWGERPVAFVAGSELWRAQLLQQLQSEFGKRHAPQAVLDLPDDLRERDKPPRSELIQLWAAESE